jgi:hypothetical protein
MPRVFEDGQNISKDILQKPFFYFQPFFPFLGFGA